MITKNIIKFTHYSLTSFDGINFANYASRTNYNDVFSAKLRDAWLEIMGLITAVIKRLSN